MTGIRPYLGRHVGSDVTLEDLSDFLKFVITVSLTYVCAISFIKYTILAFYWRLFSVSARIPICIIAASVVAWNITFICLGLFGCRPIRAAWDLTVENPHCIAPKSVYLGGSLPNVIVDFVLVLMPLPYVWRLNTSIQQRLILAGMFALGFFICIVSIVRLTIVMSIEDSDQNATYNIRHFLLWSTVEINIGLVCACLPSMRHFLKMIGLNRLFSSIRGSSRNTPGASGNPSSAAVRPSEASGKKSSRGSRSGILSTIKTGFTQFDSGDDSFQMMDNVTNHRHGKSQSQVEAGRTSDDTGGSGSSLNDNQNVTGISVQRDWSVWVDDKSSTAPQQKP